MTPVTSKSTITGVIIILGIIAVGGMAAITWLASTGTKIPDVLPLLTTGAVSAVAALLGNTRTTPDPPKVPEILSKLTDEQAAEVVRRMTGETDTILP